MGGYDFAQPAYYASFILRSSQAVLATGSDTLIYCYTLILCSGLALLFSWLTIELGDGWCYLVTAVCAISTLLIAFFCYPG